MNPLTYWILPWNSQKFNLTECLEKFDGYVDWRQQNNFSVGDNVFMYCSLPVGRITHAFEVVRTNIPFDDSYDDKEFNLEGADWNNEVPKKGYVRLKLLGIASELSPLSRENLVANGMKVNVQSGIRVSGALLEFILSGFDTTSDKGGSIQFKEGLSHTIAQTYYERDPAARLECLKHFGDKYSCEICGFNFKDVYGEIGKGFIHVHHINFLSDNKGKSTLTNPKEDLIPVCPNCHAMLHRSFRGEYLSPNHLKQILNKT